MRGVDVVRRGPERLRVGSWRGDARVAVLVPIPSDPPPSGAMVRHSCDVLAARGVTEVLTAALAPAEQRGFVDTGFELRERLHLLVHDLLTVPDVPAASLRRGRRRDQAAALAVDQAAFRPFWRLDPAGLRDAMAATPATRFRVAGSRAVVGYAITGRAGRRGYLQRLAVLPAAQGRGIGRALVVDALRWLRRRGVDQAVVNTQTDNEPALALYQALGFRLQPAGLAVLARRLDDRQPAR